jgi:hypothetical protein
LNVKAMMIPWPGESARLMLISNWVHLIPLIC